MKSFFSKRRLQRFKETAEQSPSPVTPKTVYLAPNEQQEIAPVTPVATPCTMTSTSSLTVTSSPPNVAIIALKTALEILGKAPLPGIDAATAAVLRVVCGIQGMSDAKAGWQQLAARTERLWYLVSQVRGMDGQGNTPWGESELLCAPLIKQLHKLANDMRQASDQGKLSAFFNSTGDLNSLGGHREELDSIIIDLTATLGAATNRSAAQLREDFRNAIADVHEASGNGAPSGHAMTTRQTMSLMVSMVFSTPITRFTGTQLCFVIFVGIALGMRSRNVIDGR